MWFKKIIDNKTTMILILIVILVLLLYYLNNNSNSNNINTVNTREKFEIDNKILSDKSSSNKVEFKVFYTNWCGWSKRALSLLDSEEFKNKFKEIKEIASIVLVDCENNGKEECIKRKIGGYPTMYLCKGTKLIEFTGDRTSDGIIDFIKKNQNL